MVVDDTPAGGGAAKEEGENSMRLVSSANEPPAAEDHRRVTAERRDFNVREPEPAHLVVAGIFFPVMITDRSPPARELVAGNEFGGVGARVAFQESVDVSAFHAATCADITARISAALSADADTVIVVESATIAISTAAR